MPGGGTVDPPAGPITVRPSGARIEVHTYDENGAVRNLPFNLIVRLLTGHVDVLDGAPIGGPGESPCG